jgi:hypothetical protein
VKSASEINVLTQGTPLTFRRQPSRGGRVAQILDPVDLTDVRYFALGHSDRTKNAEDELCFPVDALVDVVRKAARQLRFDSSIAGGTSSRIATTTRASITGLARNPETAVLPTGSKLSAMSLTAGPMSECNSSKTEGQRDHNRR